MNKQALLGQIVKKIETSGPTILLINNGESLVTAKAFKLDLSNLSQGDYVECGGYDKGGEFSIDYCKRSDEARKQVKKKIELGAEPKRTELSVKSEYMQKLAPEIRKAAKEIRKAVFAGRPIYVRHHCDVDGFSGGLQVEKAISQILTDSKHILKRIVMRSPLYEMDDVLRDIALAKSDERRFGSGMPLVVMLDNGSSVQDVDAIFLAKQYGFDFIVCDHHVFGGKDAITPMTLAHINQLRVGKYETCAGFMAFELARMISEDFDDFTMIPAVAGISDYVMDEVYAQYLQKTNVDEQLLKDFEKVLTWFLQSTPAMDNTAMLQSMFWSDVKFKKALIAQYLPMLIEKDATALHVMELEKDVQNVKGVSVVTIPIDIFPKRTYPKSGRAVSLLRDKEQVKNPRVAAFGLKEDGVIMRIVPEAKTSVHDVIAYLNTKLPFKVEGGGHAVAGSARFTKTCSAEELENIKKLIVEHIAQRNSYTKSN